MPYNFPTQLTAFIGRERELSDIRRLLSDPSCRLLTLVGTGGIGKTRLAIQAAISISLQFTDGVYFVPLQAVTSPDAVIYAIAEVLGVGMYEQDAPRNQLLHYLRSRNLLLVLDNFEHLLGAVDLILAILQHSPHIRLLITSREMLMLQGEQLYEVSGLTMPHNNHATHLDTYDALHRFEARAQRVRSNFTLAEHAACATHICRLVGGMPLGIELAAAWLRLLSCEEIAVEIERNIDFLATTMRDVPERHRSMRAVFEQSWRLLSGAEQSVLMHLSVLRGAFTREAAIAIADANLEILAALVMRSLLRVDNDGKYASHELLRQFAEEQLHQNAAEHAQALEAHSHYYLKLLHQLDSKIKSGEQITALNQIEFALDNIQQAWKYACEHHLSNLVLPACNCLQLYYQMRCRLSEGYEAFAFAAQCFKEHDANVYAVTLLSKSWFIVFSANSQFQNLPDLAHELRQAVDRCQLRGFAAMTVCELYRSEDSPMYIALVKANLQAYQGRQDVWGVAWSRHILGGIFRHRTQADREEAKQLYAQSITDFKSLGDLWGATWSQGTLGLLAEEEERFTDAYQLYTERLETCKNIGDAGGVAWSLQQIAKVSISLEDIPSARFYCRESLRVALDIGSKNSVAEAVLRIASLYIRVGNDVRAVELLSVAMEHLKPIDHLRVWLEQQFDILRGRTAVAVFARAAQKAQTETLYQAGWALLNELADPPMLPNSPHPTTVELLSERELDVLRLVAQGLSNREAAARLVVTVGTIKKHLNNIFGKLGVERRTQAIERARQLRLLN